MRWLICVTACIATTMANAAQFVTIGDHEVHYVVVNSLFLEPDIASRYDIVRASDRAIVNVSIIGPDGVPRDGTVLGTARNLLGQERTLEFRRFTEGTAIYFIAPIKFTDQDVLRFDIRIEVQNGPTGSLEFQERLWTDHDE